MNKLRQKAIALRKKGYTYTEIRDTLCKKIPKSTLSGWFKNIKLPTNYPERIRKMSFDNLNKARIKALVANKVKRDRYLFSVKKRNLHLSFLLKNINTAKIALAMLYFGEGSKTKMGSLMLGNSDPKIITLFLHLLRYCYKIDENKLRCTLQCRSDQNIRKLEKFWSEVTKIPLAKFYKAQIDPRTIGKKTIKSYYKGVCRIDYFSGDLYLELKQIAQTLYEGL